MGRLFGTDGVRGLANADLSPELAMSVADRRGPGAGRGGPVPPAAGGGRPGSAGQRRDARGGRGGRAGQRRRDRDPGRRDADARASPTSPPRPVPTSGVMLSASHNPMPDNGIKLFAAGGHKLPDEVEDADRGAIGRRPATWRGPTGAAHRPGARPARRRRALHQAPGGLDAAPRWTGSRSWSTAPTGRRPRSRPRPTPRPAPRSIVINAEPDGLNINDDCGSTHLESLQAAVLEHGAAPRHRPRRRRRPVPGGGRRPARSVDGDQIMAILAVAMRDAGTLTERHAGRHRDEQPRPAPGHAARGHHA